MPRYKRTKAITNVYHVIIRGINRQDIFLDKQDILKFIKELENTKEKYNYEVYAYAFMNDHIHLILHDKNENMSKAIQSLNVRYSAYYNKKYERTGHLFENRFKSKEIESIAYLKNVVRYIHKNPENAGLEPYIWTSYREFVYKSKIISPNTILKVFGNSKEEAINNFEQFHMNYSKYQDITKDFELVTKITDEDANNAIKNMLNEENPLKIQAYEKQMRYIAINKILQIEGITKEQIARITGINRKTIRNIEKSSQKLR